MKTVSLIAIAIAVAHAQEWESQRENSITPMSTEILMPEVQTLVSFVSNRPKAMRVSDLMNEEIGGTGVNEVPENDFPVPRSREEDLEDKKAYLTNKVFELVNEKLETVPDLKPEEEVAVMIDPIVKDGSTKTKKSNKQISEEQIGQELINEEQIKEEQTNKELIKEEQVSEEQVNEKQIGGKQIREEQMSEEQTAKEQDLIDLNGEEQNLEAQISEEQPVEDTTKANTVELAPKKEEHKFLPGTDMANNVEADPNVNVTEAFADKDSDFAELLPDHEEVSFLDVGEEEDEEQEEETDIKVAQSSEEKPTKQSSTTDLSFAEEEDEEEEDEEEEEEEEDELEEPIEEADTDNTLKAAAFDVNSNNNINRWDELPSKSPSDSPFNSKPEKKVDLPKKNATAIQFNARGNQSVSSNTTAVNFFSNDSHHNSYLSWAVPVTLVIVSTLFSSHL